MGKNYFKYSILIYIFFITTSIFLFNTPNLSCSPLWNNKYKNSAPFTSGTPYFPWENNGIAICTESNTQHTPKICSDGAGGAIITWVDNRYGNNDIYAQRINSNGDIQWTPDGVIICAATDSQTEPQICYDGAGGAIITWMDYRSGSKWDIYAQRISSGGIVQWSTKGIAICAVTGDQIYPQICSDKAKGAIITWQDFWSGVDYDIYAQRVNSSGIAQWKLTGVAICKATGDQLSPKICNDRAKGAIITWEDNRVTNCDIYSQRINSTGVVQWSTNGIAICTTSENQKEPQICKDGIGGAIITWRDYRGIDGDIYVQRVNSSGSMQWTTNGIAICSARYAQYELQICSDGAEGANIAWQDYRSGTSLDIYIQRVNSNGSEQWTTDGIAICTADYSQDKPKICNDGSGGAIISWTDHRNGPTNADIYVQRVNSIGGIKWLSNGSAICSVDRGQYESQICSNGAGGAIITWKDFRSDLISSSDIYAQCIKNFLPTSNHPENINTSVSGSETINWTLYDDSGGGLYRVWANDTNNDYYVWKDWTPWINNTLLSVPINRTIVGIYNYTIEYYDDQNQFGVIDTVIVEIVGKEIDGYNLLILLMSASAIAVILMRKFKRDQNHHEQYR